MRMQLSINSSCFMFTSSVLFIVLLFYLILLEAGEIGWLGFSFHFYLRGGWINWNYQYSCLLELIVKTLQYWYQGICYATKKWSPVDAVHTINLGFDQPCKICITLEISKSSLKSEMIIHFLQMWNEKRPGMLDKCNIYNVNSNQSLFSKHWTNPKYTATACMMVVGFGWHLWRNVHCFPVLAWEINLLAITNLYITCCLY